MSLNDVRKSTEMQQGTVTGDDTTGVDSPEMQAEMFEFVIAAVRVVMYVLLCEASSTGDSARVTTATPGVTTATSTGGADEGEDEGEEQQQHLLSVRGLPRLA